MRRCWFWCALTSAVLTLFFALAYHPLFQTLTSLPEVLAIMYQYRWWLIAIPLLAAPSYLLDGVFIGAAETRPMMLTMLLSTCVVYLPLWYHTQHWGNNGLWLAFTAFNASRGITLYWVYQRWNQQSRWLGPAKAKS